MKKDKLALYETLIRTSLVLIFIFALAVGTLGVLAISHVLVQSAVARPQFLDADTAAAETAR